MTAFNCGFNRWMQHTRDCASRRSVAVTCPMSSYDAVYSPITPKGVGHEEAKTTDLLHGKPEGADVGALAERRFSPHDRWFF